jgi:hypothetical protein
METVGFSESLISTSQHDGATQNTNIYSAFTDKVERNCHLPASGWNCMTLHQALQGFPDTSQVSVRKNNKIKSPVL